MQIHTIGHSTRPIDECIELLKTHGVTQLVDIRSVSGSRHNPQYGRQMLEKSLSSNGINYVYLKELGGLRHSPKSTAPVNAAWRNKSFRAYADYMQTDDFRNGIETLIQLAEQAPTAIMCAEAVSWRCHRSLVGDALVVRDVSVIDIITEKNSPEHQLTSFAAINGKQITYPPHETNSVRAKK